MLAAALESVWLVAFCCLARGARSSKAQVQLPPAPWTRVCGDTTTGCSLIILADIGSELVCFMLLLRFGLVGFFFLFQIAWNLNCLAED